MLKNLAGISLHKKKTESIPILNRYHINTTKKESKKKNKVPWGCPFASPLHVMQLTERQGIKKLFLKF
jgi:hypothetical protein